MKSNDSLLLKAAQNLDANALTEIFNRFSPVLYKYSLRLCHVQEVAERIVGDVFVQFIEQLATNNVQTDNLRAYLYKIAYQLLLDHARANPQNALAELTLSQYVDKQFVPTSIETEEQILLQELISAFNTELTYEQRHIIVLRFLEDFSLKETALIVGKTIHSVKATQNRGILKLRKVMGIDKYERHSTIESNSFNLDLPNSSTNNVLSSMLSGNLTNIASSLSGRKTKNIEIYEPTETKLHVANLPYNIDDIHLMNLFSKAGTVKFSQVFKDNIGLKSSAYVVMSTLAEAIRAMYLYHRKGFDGQYLSVKIGEKEQEDEIDDLSSNTLNFEKRRLRVFLCHAHKDVLAVQDLYTRLISNHIDAWLDKEKLLPGSDWEYEIRQAVRSSDIIIVCLSKGFDQKGFRQKEVRIALEESALQPEGEIFIVPARLEECEVLPSLRHLHWVNLYEFNGYEKLIRTLKTRAQKLDILL